MIQVHLSVGFIAAVDEPVDIEKRNMSDNSFVAVLGWTVQQAFIPVSIRTFCKVIVLLEDSVFTIILEFDC